MIEKLLIYIDLIINKMQLTQIFYKVVYMSILGIIIGLIIYLIQEIFDKKITPKWKIAMWMILLISLILPINIGSNYKNSNLLLSTLEPIQNISFKQKAQEKRALYNSYI